MELQNKPVKLALIIHPMLTSVLFGEWNQSFMGNRGLHVKMTKNWYHPTDSQWANYSSEGM